MKKKTVMRKIKTIAQRWSLGKITTKTLFQDIGTQEWLGRAGQPQLEEQTVLESTVHPERESLQRLAMPRLEKTHTDLLSLEDANRSP